MSPESAAEPRSFCQQCGAALTPDALSCNSCHGLVHATELQRLAEEAKNASLTGDLKSASAAWRKALGLLPPETLQYKSIDGRLADIETRIAAPGPAAENQRHSGSRAKWLAVLGPVGLILWKSKVVIFVLLSKAKLLLLGLTKLSTLGSMLAFLGVYWSMWGWKFALGFVLCLYVHEMGHVAELRRFGIAASAPMFIPGLGAFVSLKQLPENAMQDSRVGLAGPIWGLGAATLCLLLGWALNRPILTAIGASAAWMNLFNLIPVWQLDGGRGFRALNRGHRLVALAAILFMWAITGKGLLFLLALGAGFRLWFQKDFAQQADYVALGQFVGLTVLLSMMSATRL